MDGWTDLVVLCKNLMSLQLEERYLQLMGDLDTAEWDVLLCQETWREQQVEIFETSAGHLFVGS